MLAAVKLALKPRSHADRAGVTLAGFAVWDRRDAMIQEGPNTHWDHVHQCGGCGHAVRIDHIDLKIITGGVFTCPHCERSGPINVKIMDENLIPASLPPSHRNR